MSKSFARGCVFVGLLLWAMLGCATVQEADLALKEWTSKQFRTRDGGKKESAEAGEKADGADPKKGADQNAAAPAGAASATSAGTDSNAQPPPAPTGTSAAAAEALFESGHEAMNAGDFDTACARFRESNRLDPAVGAVLNLAVCEEQRGRLATAWQLFKTVMSELPAGDDRYPIAQRHASALRPRVPLLTLELAPNAPKDTSVLYGDVVFGPASFSVPLPMDPGAQRIVVRAPNRKDRAYSFRLSEAERKELVIEPGEKK